MGKSSLEDVIQLYRELIGAWNKRNSDGMSELFLDGGEMIGYDGSQINGKKEIFSHLEPIFANHPTAAYVCKVKSIKLLSNETALLRAIAGMVPDGKDELNPSLNAHQTLLAVKTNGTWRIELFQNTPAQFHGRPDLVQRMTDELRKQLFE
ncbi:SgcJ/EcaC family oxidoreductase [Fictibacillus terranigra]|uniref:SgcJ/EcaC family oxidoreductase n=1 Tax=Fictibacillus terranigra TaxID=3058424 RepID=A0ABT8E818_9BACL|nr:SgcJ/EcaC family oxidoreductase [Fictibacillus sp. CENA-BCM004]MDN4074039.1 SgcJ/EcaC family oxidoreductase [Fictibacillus sp. CENA-BCM004]